MKDKTVCILDKEENKMGNPKALEDYIDRCKKEEMNNQKCIVSTEDINLLLKKIRDEENDKKESYIGDIPIDIRYLKGLEKDREELKKLKAKYDFPDVTEEKDFGPPEEIVCDDCEKEDNRQEVWIKLGEGYEDPTEESLQKMRNHYGKMTSHKLVFLPPGCDVVFPPKQESVYCVKEVFKSNSAQTERESRFLTLKEMNEYLDSDRSFFNRNNEE